MRERDVTDFPEPEFANKADSLTRIDRERDAVHGDDRPAISLEFDPQIVDRHQRPGVVLRCEKRFSG